MAFVQLELIAHAPDGLEGPLVAHALQLFPQALDVNIHRPGVAEVIKAPDLVQELVPGKDPVGGGGQVEQQLQFLRGRIHPLALDLQLVGVQVDDQSVKGQAAGFDLVPAQTAQDGVDAGQQLFHLKGLDDIVIRAHLQPGDLVDRLALGRQHDDGGLSLFPDVGAHGPAVHDGQHDVQQDQIGAEEAI